MAAEQRSERITAGARERVGRVHAGHVGIGPAKVRHDRKDEATSTASATAQAATARRGTRARLTRPVSADLPADAATQRDEQVGSRAAVDRLGGHLAARRASASSRPSPDSPS